jgi:hypothetical protein
MSDIRRCAAVGLYAAVGRGRRRGTLVIGTPHETGQEKAGEATVGADRR